MTDKVKTFIQQLIELTKSGRITWQIGDSVYTTDILSNKVVIYVTLGMTYEIFNFEVNDSTECSIYNGSKGSVIFRNLVEIINKTQANVFDIVNEMCKNLEDR